MNIHSDVKINQCNDYPHPVVIDDLIEKSKNELIEFLKKEKKEFNIVFLYLKGYEEATWPDTSLGCDEPGHHYAQVMTNGYKVRFEYEGKIYTIHIDAEGEKIVSLDFNQRKQNVPLTENLPSIFDLSKNSGQS